MMDCVRAVETILEALDSDPASLPDHREALEHCRACPACERTASGVARLSRLTAPGAPAGLAERIVAAVAAERDAGAGAAEQGPSDAAPDSGAELEEAFRSLASAQRRVVPRWVPWATFAAGAAAALLGAFIVARAGLSFLGGTGVSTDDVPPPPVVATQGGESAPAAAPEAADRQAAQASAPSLVSYENRVWRLLSGFTPDRSALTTQGTLSTDLGTGSTATRDVLRSSDLPESIVVVGPDGALTAFTLVRRTWQGRAFVLVPGRPLDRFGEWPRLPSSIPEPVSEDGSPTFSQAGTDDLGVPVYPLTGTDPARGFAIAPGTGISDPAASNPGWTWWVPF